MATVNLGAIKFNWKGAFNNSTAYAVDDVVSSGGSSYVCILASTGNAVSNGTYWNIMSSAGTNGTDVGTTLTTQGDILYRDGSGLQRLAKGTAGQVLQMNSGATAPEYANASGGVSEGFSAYDNSSGNQSGSLTLTSTLVNTNGNFNTANGRYTAPSAGTYYFYAFALSSGSTTDLYFKVNGSNTATGTDYSYSGGAGDLGHTSMIYPLSQGDYVQWVSVQSVYGNYLGFGGFKLY